MVLAPYAEVMMLSKENKKPLERKRGHLQELNKAERTTWAQAYGVSKVGV